jgi:two-component system, OmpR family, response regulator
MRDCCDSRNGPTASGTSNQAVADRTNRPHHLLFIATDFLMRHQMVDYFRQHQLRATSAAALREALRQLAADQPDLVVLDNRLSQANSLDLLRSIRLASDVPLIIVGRQDLVAADRTIALELGADDYINAPIDLRELVARIRALLRRREGRYRASANDKGRCRFGGWQLDRNTRRLVSPDGRLVVLSKSEHALLDVFLDAPLQPLTRDCLLMRTNPIHEDLFDRAIDVRVLRLRRKLEKDPTSPRLIKTERGIGYVFAVSVDYLR